MSTKDVEINVKVDVGGNAVYKLKEIEDATKKANEAAKQANVASRVGPPKSPWERPEGSSGSPSGGVGGGLAGKNGVGGIVDLLKGGIGNLMKSAGPAAGPLAVASAAYLATAAAAEKSADAMTILSNQSKTGARKIEELVDQFIPGAASFRRLNEAVSGTTEKLRQINLQYEVIKRQTQLEAANNAKTSSANYSGAMINARADAYRGVQPLGSQAFDRSTVAGEIAQRNADRRGEAADSVQRAQTELEASRKAAAEQQKVTEDAVREREGAQFRLKEAEGVVDYFKGVENGTQKRQVTNDTPWLERQASGGGGREAFAGGLPVLALMGKAFGMYQPRDKAGMTKALESQSAEEAKVGTASVQVETEKTRLIERQKQLRESESQMRKELINQQRVELSILQEKEQRMAQTQQRLGMMNRGQFEQAKAAALYIQQNGLDNATDEMKSLAQSVAPGTIAKLAEGQGAGRGKELFEAGLKDEFGVDFGKDSKSLEAIRKQVDKVKAEIRVDVLLDTKQTAKDLADSINPLLKELIKELTIQLKSGVDEVKKGQALRQETGG